MSVPPKPAPERPGGIYPQPAGAAYAAPQPQPQNTWGLIGLILSVIGLIGSCGLLSPIGLILSTIGLFKEPRGMAIAGFIVGLIGTLFLALVGFAFIMMFLAMIGLVSATATVFEQAASYVPMFEAQTVLARDWKEDGIPDEKTGNELLANQFDIWGNPIKYETDGKSFTLRSAGKDEIMGNSDDLTLGPFTEVQRPDNFDTRDPSQYPDDVIDKMPPKIREQMRKEKERMNQRELVPGPDDSKSGGQSASASGAAESATAGDKQK